MDIDLAYGRNINSIDIESGRNICLIGTDIVQKFFGGSSERAVDEIIKVNNVPYRVVGTMEEKGSSMGMSWDNVVITSYKNVTAIYQFESKCFFLDTDKSE